MDQDNLYRAQWPLSTAANIFTIFTHIYTALSFLIASNQKWQKYFYIVHAAFPDLAFGPEAKAKVPDWGIKSTLA